MQARCFGFLSTLEQQLTWQVLAPLLILGAGLTITRAKGTSQSSRGVPFFLWLLRKLPFMYGFFSLVYPFITSRAFRALAPCDCFEYTDGSETCFLIEDYSLICSTQEHAGLRTVAWIAIFLYGVAFPCGVAALLFLARKPVQEGRSTPLTAALKLLYAEYNREVYWWELVEIGRKLIFTGFLALVSPGSLTQLFSALLVAQCMLVVQLWIQPYREHGNNVLAMLSSFGILLIFVATVGLKMDILAGMSALPSDSSAVPSVSQLVVLLCLSAFSAILVALAMFARSIETERHLPMLVWQTTGHTVRAERADSYEYHAFLSHVWPSGQDQCRHIKDRMLSLALDVKCFLDLDDLEDVSLLEDYVQSSRTVVVFLSGSLASDGSETSDYMASKNCLRELRAAKAHRRRIVLVVEQDANHGGVSLETHKRDCPEDLQFLFEPSSSEHADVVCVPWRRGKHFQAFSMRKIMQAVLCEEARGHASDILHQLDVTQVRAKPQSMSRTVRLALKDRIGGQSGVQSDEQHLYVSKHNVKAERFLEELLAAAGPTGPQVSRDERNILRAEKFLVYLTLDAFDSDHGQLLAEEISQFLDRENSLQHMILVHETRTERNGVGAFRRIIGCTPQKLLDLNVYTKIAIPMYGDDHLDVGLSLVLAAISDAGTKPQQQQLWSKIPISWSTWPVSKRAKIKAPSGKELDEVQLA